MTEADACGANVSSQLVCHNFVSQHQSLER